MRASEEERAMNQQTSGSALAGLKFPCPDGSTWSAAVSAAVVR